MTVALGLVCDDGVIVAADSMSSTVFQTAHLSQKVNAVEALKLVWTASGSVYVIEEVETALQKLAKKAGSNKPLMTSFKVPNLNDLRQHLAVAVHPAMKAAYEAAMPGVNALQTPMGTQHPWNSDFLILGFSNDKPFFLEFSGDGQINWHTPTKFAAVGSGGPFAEVANGLMAHYVEGQELPVDLGLWVAYRAIEATCRVSSSSVGLPVQLAIADSDGARILTPDEVREVQQGVEGWLTAEKEFLQQTAWTDTDGDSVAEDDLPPELDD